MTARVASILFAGALAAAWPGTALPQDDARVALLQPGPDARLTLPTGMRTPQTILFPPGEQIVDVMISDPGAYRSGVSTSGDSLVLVPEGEVVLAQMTVETQARRYLFDLVPASAGIAPLVVQVGEGASLPATAALAEADTAQEVPPDTGQYRMRGDRSVRPSAISDDGDKTYVRWLDSQSMPAVFGIGPSGEEEMVEGHMRGGIFTIDRVYGELVFRIDKEKASARRQREGARR